MNKLQTIIFDLDGVLVDTARYHFLAWKAVADENQLFFNEQINERLKGVSRQRSFEIVLEVNNCKMHETAIQKILIKKNDIYLEYINKLDSSAVLPGINDLIAWVKNAGLNIILGSASKNAQLILDKTGLLPHFDHLVDGNMVSKAKPNPEVFLKGAVLAGTKPQQCLVFEDAEAGVQAALSAGMKTIGIGSSEQLCAADLVAPDTTGKEIYCYLQTLTE